MTTVSKKELRDPKRETLSDDELTAMVPGIVKLMCVHVTERELDEGEAEQLDRSGRDVVDTTTVMGTRTIRRLNADASQIEEVTEPYAIDRVTREKECPEAGKVEAVPLASLDDPARACPTCGYLREIRA